MKRPLSALLVAISFITPAAAATTKPLAMVDGQPLTGEDLKEAFSRNHSGHLSFLAGEVEVRKALDKAIDRKLLLQEAERLDLASRPEVKEAVDELVEKMSFEHLLKVEIEDPAQPTEAEIRAAFDEHTHELVQVRQIVVGTQAEADEIAGLIKGGQSLEELAKLRSQALSKRDGGLLPPIGWGTMDEAWDDVVFKLQADQVSAPFHSSLGWEIVQMVKRLPVEAVEYDKAHNKMEGILLRRKLDARKREFSAQLFAKYGVVVQLQPFDPNLYATTLAKDPNAVVATWTDGQSTVGEIAEGADFKQMAHGRPETQAAEDLEALVRQSVNEKLAHLEALARHFEKLPEIATAARQLSEDVMEGILYAEYVFKDVKVTDADLRAWYDGHQDELKSPETRQVSHILVATQPEAVDARARLDKGEPFAEVAKQISKDTDTAKKGGDLGWISAKDVPQGWEKVTTLGEGQVSEPLQSKFGWHLVLVTKIRPPQPQPFEAVKANLQNKLLLDRRKAEREQWLEKLRAAAKIKINDEAVKRFAKEIEPKELKTPEGHAIPGGHAMSPGQSVPPGHPAPQGSTASPSDTEAVQLDAAKDDGAQAEPSSAPQ